ncbi:MAG: DUF2067 family protein [Ignisphaera sp.]
MPKPSGIYIEKTFTYLCPNTSICLEILQKIDEELSLDADLYAEFKLNKLVFKIMGLEPNVQSAMAKLREFLALYTSSKASPRRGIDANVIAKHIKRTIPLDVLAVVVKKNLGVSAEVRGSTIYVDTDLETLLDIARKVAESYQRIESMSLPSSLKKLLTAAEAIYNVDYREVLDLLRDAQLVSEDNELKIPWIQAITELENLLESS